MKLSFKITIIIVVAGIFVVFGNFTIAKLFYEPNVKKNIEKNLIMIENHIINLINRKISDRTRDLQAYMFNIFSEDELSVSNLLFDQLLDGKEIVEDDFGKLYLKEDIIKIESELMFASTTRATTSIESDINKKNYKSYDSFDNFLTAKNLQWKNISDSNDNDLIINLQNNSLATDIREKFELKNYYKNNIDFYLYDNIVITNKYGVVVAMTDYYEDYYNGDKEWWQKAKDEGVIYEDLQYSDTAVGTIPISIAIRDHNNNFFGVAKIFWNIEEIISLIQSEIASNNDNSEYILLNSLGEYIFPMQIFVKDDVIDTKIYEDKELVLNNNESGVVYNDDHIIAYNRIKNFNNDVENSWVFVMKQDKKQLYQSIFQVYKYTIMTILIYVIIAIILTFISIRHFILKPLKVISGVTNSIISGNLEDRVDIKNKDEIGMLASNLNLMADTIIKASNKITKIIKIMPLPLVITSLDGKIISLNRSLLNILGYQEKELINNDLVKIFNTLSNPEEFLKIEIGKEKLMKKKIVKNSRIYLKCKTGEILMVSLSAMLISEEGANSILFVMKDLGDIQKYAKKRLSQFTPILHKVALGDFSEKIPIPIEEDEFTEHLVALNLMIDDFKEMIVELNEKSKILSDTNEELITVKQNLEKKVKDRTRELEEAKDNLERKVWERTEELEKIKNTLESQVEKRTNDLTKKIKELERFNNITIGRELRIIELKNEVADLKNKLKKYL